MRTKTAFTAPQFYSYYWALINPTSILLKKSHNIEKMTSGQSLVKPCFSSLFELTIISNELLENYWWKQIITILQTKHHPNHRHTASTERSGTLIETFIAIDVAEGFIAAPWKPDWFDQFSKKSFFWTINGGGYSLILRT